MTDTHIDESLAAPKPKGPSVQMPVTVQPGVAALMALLKADDGFAVDLKRGIVSEVVRQLMPKSLDGFMLDLVRTEVSRARSDLLLAGCEAKTLDEVARVEVLAAVERIRSDSWTQRLPESSDGRKSMVEAVRSRIDAAARLAVEEVLVPDADTNKTVLTQAIEKRVAVMEKNIAGPLSDKIEAEVGRRVTIAFEAEVQRRVDEKLAAIRAALA